MGSSPLVSSQPPHRAMQYALAAQIIAALARVISGASPNFTTFGGGCSSSILRTALPTRHPIDATQPTEIAAGMKRSLRSFHNTRLYVSGEK